MSVLINMEMPKNGSCIQIVIDDDGKVYHSVEKCILKMGSIAKAVPVPPHGRLVDADRLLSEHMKQKYYHLPNGDTAIPIIDVEHAPTIIPADPAEEPREE